MLVVLPSLLNILLRTMSWTWRVREVSSRGRRPGKNANKGIIWAIWHGQIIPSIAYYADSPAYTMASQSFDGELISRTLVKLGFPEPVRGSTSKGGRSALKKMMERVKASGFGVLTPDGPRGPRHVAQEGIVALAKTTGLPLVPVAFHCSWVIRLRSWDKTEIPLPFTRGVAVFGEPLYIDRKDTRGLQKFQDALEGVNKTAAIELSGGKNG